MPNAKSHVSFGDAFRFWVKLGFISFGGPAGQIAIMHTEVVERRKWISEERFLHALNYCMLLPGPEAQQLATYIGWLLHGTRGALVAGGFFILPSVFLLLALSYLYAAYGHLPVVTGVLAGFKPVVVAIVVEAVLKIGSRALKQRRHYLIAAAAFVAIYFLHVPFPLIVLLAGVLGLALSRGTSRPKIVEGENLGASQTAGRGLRLSLIFAILWILPLALLVAWRGWSSLHAHEYRFFTLAALVTFGGAYSVLAYVTQAAVGTFGWITQTQAVDGLALAETTPGPLIMVLQFVGFMAAWNHPEGLSPTASAVVGALITTYTTFLPCFFFILLGAPHIERLRGNPFLTGALSAITAAVVGVVLNLALVFGAAVIWPEGWNGGTHWLSIVLSAAAFVALYLFKLDVLLIVVAGGLAGLARAYLFG